MASCCGSDRSSKSAPRASARRLAVASTCSAWRAGFRKSAPRSTWPGSILLTRRPAASACAPGSSRRGRTRPRHPHLAPGGPQVGHIQVGGTARQRVRIQRVRRWLDGGGTAALQPLGSRCVQPIRAPRGPRAGFRQQPVGNGAEAAIVDARTGIVGGGFSGGARPDRRRWQKANGPAQLAPCRPRCA